MNAYKQDPERRIRDDTEEDLLEISNSFYSACSGKHDFQMKKTLAHKRRNARPKANKLKTKVTLYDL